MTSAYRYAPNAPEPWNHQRRFFELSRDEELFALFMEQRTGKSRIIVDTAAYAYERDIIDAVVILAPNGVHINWVTESFPQFLPKRIAVSYVAWRSGRMETRRNRETLEDLLTSGGLVVLSLNYDALLTKGAKDYLSKFLRRRKCLGVADEADDLSTPSAKRTRTAERVGANCKMRRILTGTPAAEGPLGLYSQTNFLRHGILGCTSYYAFKHEFGEWEEGYNGNTGATFEKLKSYKNLDELNRRLSAFSVSITRAECGGQVAKNATRRFLLAPKQREIYNQLAEQFRAELREEASVSARMVITRYIRLQQIASGFAILDRQIKTCPTCDATDPTCGTCDGLGVIVPENAIEPLGPNPRLEALEAELRGTKGQTVIWTRFRWDVDTVTARLRALGRRAARYDGAVGAKEREETKGAFQAGQLDDLVASPQAAGRGLDFSMARTSFFYSHHWSLRLRLQSQDRVENLNRKDPATLVDLVADETVDDLIVACHREKRNIQDMIFDNPRREWL